MGRDSAIIRPIRAADLEPVREPTRHGGTGLTNLPPDREGKLRVRGFAVRAGGDRTASEALFTLSDDTARAASFGYAALGLAADDDEVRWVTDPDRSKLWAPRL